ncbi:MAG: PrsW family glutamic-type intramembrane protease [Clostridia bacterium]|nr:PrsW family glutamic-type intramembrane protease [Clostridia bacterium]
MEIIGGILSLIIPFLLYRFLLKGTVRTISNKEYILRSVIAGTFYMIPISLFLLITVWIFHLDFDTSTLIGAFLKCFITYALLEEAIKFYFTNRLLNNRPQLGMKEAVLYAGTVGLGFGFTEKLLQGGVALIQNAILPSHALFQWIMGYYIYKAARAEGSERKKYYALAFLIPYVVHGLWDFGLEGGGVLLDESYSLTVRLIGGCLMAACIILNVVVFIAAIVKIYAASRLRMLFL